jgi:hypothetical protein
MEVVKETNYKNKDLMTLLSVYVKLCSIDFELDKDVTNVEKALQVAEDYLTIESSFKAFQTLEKNIKEKVQKQADAEGNVPQEVIEKANKDLEKLYEGESKLSTPLSKIGEDFLKKIKARPMEVLLLKQKGLI